MRTVTFSNSEVARVVNENFVATWTNRKPGFHNCEKKTEARIQQLGDSYPTRNFCTYFLTPQKGVLHYFTGYFAPGIFLREVRMAQEAKGGAIAGFVSLHQARAEELRRELKDPPPKSNRGEGWKESFEEGRRYLIRVHEHLVKKALGGSLPSFALLQRNHLHGNEFTEEEVSKGRTRKRSSSKKESGEISRME